MPDELIELLRRETAATEQVESRLRAVELLAAADEHRFLTVALDELEAATERLAALEVARTLALMGADYPEDVSASHLVADLDRDGEPRVRAAIEGLRLAVDRLADTRGRAIVAVSGGRDAVLARLETSGAVVGA